jgi:hypothetical protein
VAGFDFDQPMVWVTPSWPFSVGPVVLIRLTPVPLLISICGHGYQLEFYQFSFERLQSLLAASVALALSLAPFSLFFTWLLEARHAPVLAGEELQLDSKALGGNFGRLLSAA